MRCCSIISGSSGNCVYIESENTHVLIDAGASGRQIELGLREAKIDPWKLDAILVTHEHNDHIQGVGVLSRKFRVPVFANAGTWGAMARKIGRISPPHHKIFKDYHKFKVGEMDIMPFSIHHDAVEPVGFAIESGNEKVSVITDTGFVDDDMMEAIEGSDIYYFEANHDEMMLMTGSYPNELKARILSKNGHLSNKQAGEALKNLLRERGESVLLAHMSMENNEEVLCLNTVVGILEDAGVDVYNKQNIMVAPRYVPSKFICCREEIIV